MTKRHLQMFVLIVIAFVAVSLNSANAQTVVTVQPSDTLTVSNCYPFGQGAASGDFWNPNAGFVYQNIPAFDIYPGDILAFDLGSMNDSNIQLEIAMAPTTVNGGDVNASAFTTIVSNTQIPSNPMGDAVTGNFELQFVVENAFSFPGGGLIIRFSNPAGAFALDATCDQVLVHADSTDASGYFVERFYNDADGVSPWDDGSTDSIGGFQLTIDPANAYTIPTMNEWGAIIFVLIAGAASVIYLRKRKEI